MADPPPQSENSTKLSTIKCYNCKEIGHIRKNCPKPIHHFKSFKKQKNEVKETTTTANPTTSKSTANEELNNQKKIKTPIKSKSFHNKFEKKKWKTQRPICELCAQHHGGSCPFTQSEANTMKLFTERLRNDNEASMAAVAMQILIDVIAADTRCTTVQGLHTVLTEAIREMSLIDNADASLSSGCELLMRFITLTSMEQPDFQECRNVLLERAKCFLEYVSLARDSVATNACDFLPSGSLNCLVFGHSRVVMHALRQMHANGTDLNCLVVSDTAAWYRISRALRDCVTNSPEMRITRIHSDAVSVHMSYVDCVLLGAEAFCQSGGIINRLGTRNIAVIAKQFNKPVYALLEFFKFCRSTPLRTEDLAPEVLFRPVSLKPEEKKDKELCLKKTPRVDYTDHSLISMVIYDQGVLPPEVATVEIIRLYT